MTHDDDPFFDGKDADRTVIRPKPGGRRTSTGKSQNTRASPPQASEQPARHARAGRSVRVQTPGLNPLVDSASPLLVLGNTLRSSVSHPDPEGLNQHICAEIKQFEENAKKRGCRPEPVLAGRYALCTFIDEIVLGAPWGAHSAWSEKTLLATFHREGWGGEKFFAILDRVCKDPVKNIDLIELQYLMLTLGFEGKYGARDRGQRELRSIQDRVHHLLANHHGEVEQALSPHWEGEQDLRNPLQEYIPLWAVTAGASAVLLAIFMGFKFMLNNQADHIIEELQALGRTQAAIADQRPSVTKRLNLRRFLAPEIEQGLVTVEDRAGYSDVTLIGNGLFATGSAAVTAGRQPLLQRVAEALNTEKGRIHIVGHTDNIPISGSLRLKFPSNYDLSQARADGVMNALERLGVSSARMSTEGVGDDEPLVENDTPSNRALNRRVVIRLSSFGR